MQLFPSPKNRIMRGPGVILYPSHENLTTRIAIVGSISDFVNLKGECTRSIYYVPCCYTK